MNKPKVMQKEDFIKEIEKRLENKTHLKVKWDVTFDDEVGLILRIGTSLHIRKAVGMQIDSLCEDQLNDAEKVLFDWWAENYPISIKKENEDD